MFAAQRDRAEAVRVLIQRNADLAATSDIVDFAKLAADAPAVSPGPPQTPPPASPQPANAPRPEPRRDVAGVTRPFRFDELVGTQGGLTALHFAARQGASMAVKALVEGGDDPNRRSPGDQTTPLLIATINGQFDIAAYLLEKGADPTLASTGGATPLYAALNVEWAPKASYPQPRAYLQQQVSYLELMARLLDKGADVNARLTKKVWYSNYVFDVSSVDEAGATPFWRAAYASDVDAMRLLIAHGADPNIPTAKSPDRRRGDADAAARPGTEPPVPVGGPGLAPLHAASGPGYGAGYAGNAHHVAPGGMLAAVTYLVDELHADVNLADADGNTAMHNAAARGDNEMIQYLVSKGADVTRVNRQGQTTVDLANGPIQRVQPFPETIALLEKLGAKNNHKCVSC
jgi:ankyrin repeat protein